MAKKYRFFYHYYRQYKCLSVHFRNQCYKVENVVCNVPCNSKWSERQPNLVMQGFAEKLDIVNNTAIFS